MYIWFYRRNVPFAKLYVTVIACYFLVSIIWFIIDDFRRSNLPVIIFNPETLEKVPSSRPPTTSTTATTSTTTRPSSIAPFSTAVRKSRPNTLPLRPPPPPQQRPPPPPPPPPRQSEVNSTSIQEVKTFKELYQPGFEVSRPELCYADGFLAPVVIIIICDPLYTKRRRELRNTQTYFKFAREHHIPIAFLLGQTQDPIIARHVRAESALYKDIIINKNIEGYKNLPLKVMSMLEWFQTYCSKARYILKVDDDVLIDVRKLLTFVEKRIDNQNVIYGRIALHTNVQRQIGHINYVSEKEYPGEKWPYYLYGPVYLMSSDVPSKLYRAAVTHPYIPIEDAFFTGIVAEREGVRRIHFMNVFEHLRHRKHTIVAGMYPRKKLIHGLEQDYSYDEM